MGVDGAVARDAPLSHRRGPHRLGRRAQRVDRASATPRPTTAAILVGPTDGPESMLVVPMTYDDRVEGVIVARQARPGPVLAPTTRRPCRSSPGIAAQALVNAENVERRARQQGELEHQLASQRRLLEVNETLLSTLDPHAVLERIADGLKAVVAYDTLTIYRDRPRARRPAAGRRPRPVRRRDPGLRRPARRRAHRLGDRPQRGGPARTTPTSIRASIQIPGTPVRARVADRRPAGRAVARSSGRSTSAGWASRRRTSRRTSSSSPSCSPVRPRSRSRTPRLHARSRSGPSATR